MEPRAMSEFRRFYDKRAGEYNADDWEGCLRYEAALKIARFRERNKVLDVGCKFSILSDLLNERAVPHSYYGVDISHLVLGKRKVDNGGLLVADVNVGFPIADQSVTHVFCLELLEHVIAPLGLLGEFYRVLVDGGQLLLSVPNPYYWRELYGNLWGVPDSEGHIGSFTIQTMHRLFDFTRFSPSAHRGTYFRMPLLGGRIPWIWRPAFSVKWWFWSRSVVFLGVKQGARQQAATQGGDPNAG
jgi:SAM-dependent methyltransferase